MFRQKAFYGAKQFKFTFQNLQGWASNSAGGALLTYPSTVKAGDVIFMAAGNTDGAVISHASGPSMTKIYEDDPYGSYHMALFWRRLDGTEASQSMGSFTYGDVQMYGIYHSNLPIRNISETLVYRYGGTGNPASSTVDLSTGVGSHRIAVCQTTSNYQSVVTQSGATPDFTQNQPNNPIEGYFSMLFNYAWDSGDSITWDQSDTTGARSFRTYYLTLTV